MLPSTKLHDAAESEGWTDHTMLCVAMNFLDHAASQEVQQAFAAYVDESKSEDQNPWGHSDEE